jgi:hypothetical protein
MFFGCIEEGTIVYDQDYPEAPENIGGSGSGNDRVPGDGAGSAGGTSDGSGAGSNGGSSDGNGSDGAGSTGASGDGVGSDGGDTSAGSSDGSGSTGHGAGSAGGTSDGSGDGSTGGSSTGDGNGSDGGDTSTGSSDGSGSTGDGSDGGSSDGAGSTGGSTGVDGGDGAVTDGGDSGDGAGTGDGSGTGDGAGTGDGGNGNDNGTELDAPTVTLTPKEQKIVVSWSPVDNATSYNLTWLSSDGTENIINVSAQQVADGADPILFAHAPLVAGQNYTYTVTAVAADGTEAVGTPLTNSALPLGCTPSTYSPEGLVAYYSFEGDLSDSNGSYDFTATGDSIAYSNGCVNGLAGHFDGDGGYGYNLDFTDENVDEVADGNWSISVWVNADEDMNKFASIFSTTDVHGRNGTPEDGWGQGFQLSMTSDMKPQLFACKHCDGSQKVTAPNALEINEWTHLAVTMDNGTAKLYVNSDVVATGDGIVTEFNRLQVGINRFGQEPWKGYVDELMVFGDTLSDEDIKKVYENTLPGTPQNVAAINWAGDTVVVAWEEVEGVNEYNVYYQLSTSVNENSPYITVTGGTVVNFDNLTQGHDYTYAVAGVSPLGVGELSAPTTVTVDGMLLANEPAYETTVDNVIYNHARKAEAMEFSPDGSKMYLILGAWTKAGSFVQYDLATPWDPRTATQTKTFKFAGDDYGNTCFTNNFKFIADGTKLIGLNDASNNDKHSTIRVWDVDVAYDISTINAASEKHHTLETYTSTRITHPFAFEFNPEGTRMWVGGHSRMGDIGVSQEWELAGPYDFSKMTKLAQTDGRYFRQGTSADTHQEVIWKADGTKFILLQDEGSVRTFNVSVPFELSSSVYGTESAITEDKEIIKFPYQRVRAIHFSPAQDRLYYVTNEADGTVAVGSMPFSW